MPSLFTNSSAAKGSTRRPRGESESRRPTSHRVDSERRRAAKEQSSSRGTDRRSPPSKTNPATASLYSQPNITQDQTTVSSASDSESSPLSPRSPEMRVTNPAPGVAYQYTLETPLALQQYLDTEDEDATPQPKKELAIPPPAIRRQPAMATPVTPAKHEIQQYLSSDSDDDTPQQKREPVPSAPTIRRQPAITSPIASFAAVAPAPTAPVPPPAAILPAQPAPPPSTISRAQEAESRPLTPEAADARDDLETVTGSPQHMSMSMPHLQRNLSRDSQLPAPSPSISRAFTPPAPLHPSNIPQLAQPMPMYPYSMQDPRAYYNPPMQHMQQAPPQAPQPPPQYMYEPRYDEPRYDMPRQPLGPYYNQSPDPYRHHRLSMASVGADSQYTQDSGDRATVASHGHTATGRTSPQDETTDLLSRIQTALPDLQLLLSRCEEVTGHHSHHKEQKLLTSGAGEDGHVEALLKQKDIRIEELEKELAAKTQTHVAERNKMRFEIGNLQEQYKDIQEDLVSFKRNSISNGSKSSSPVETKHDLAQIELETSRRKAKELEDAQAASDRQIASLEAQLRTLMTDLESKKSAEASLHARLRETTEAHARERNTLVAAAAAASGPGNSSGLRTLNETLAREKSDLEAALRSKDTRLEESRKIWAKDLEEARKHSAYTLDEARKQHAKELSDAQAAVAEEKTKATKLLDEERAKAKAEAKAEAEKEARSTTRRHEKALAELERNLEAKFDEQYKDVEAELSKARRDYKRVKRDWHVDKERASEERGKLRAAAVRVREEHAGLVRLLEAFSEPTERDREREKKEAERELRERKREGGAEA